MIANGSIRNRIYLGFGVVLVLVALQVGVALRGLDRIRQLRDDIVQQYEPPLEAAANLERGVLLRAIALRNYVAGGEGRHLREYDRQLAIYTDGLERIEGMPLDVEGRAALAELAAVSREHVRRTAGFVSLHERRASADAMSRAEAQLSDAREALLARIRDFDDVQRRRLADARMRMAVLEGEVRWWLLGAALLVAAALGATAFLTTRTVRRPALTLMAAAGALERGDYGPALALAASPHRPPKGELPVLAAAFAHMAEALRRREERTAADARLAAALTGSLDPEAAARGALAEIAAYAHAHVAAVYRLEAGTLRRVAGRSAEGIPETLPCSGIVAEALAAGRAVELADVPADLPFVVHAGFGAVRPRAVVAVPFDSGGERNGVLLLGSLRPLRAEAVAFAVAAARHVGIALHGAFAHARIAALAAELCDGNARLQAQNEELQAQGEEIQAQTEELVAQGDEIRRHNDELAAAKEALAAKAAALEDVDRRKNEFLATLGHELRNPLAAIATAGTLLEADARDERVSRRADVISRQVRHLRRLVDDLLDLSRINHGKIELRLERIDACSAVEAAIQAVRHEATAKEQSIAFRRGPAVPVEADPVRLEQVLSNLLRNAVRYTPPAGTITVAVETDGVEAVIQVGDTGMGISPELLPRIFEPFIQGTHSEGGEQGLGLGLALVRRLVEMHGGDVEARSDGEGTGTVFVVRLPLAAVRDLPDEAPAQRAPEASGDGRTRVLLVEDDPDLAEVTAEVLEMFGFAVRVEGDADAGLRACLEWRPDVALLDIGLPGRSGYELARDLRTRLPGDAVRLVAVTGYGQPEDRARAFAAGFDQHLVKPVPPGELRDVVMRLAGLAGVDAAA